MTETNPALLGPWVAVLFDPTGVVYASLDDLDPEGTFDVGVVRGSAAPVDGRWPSGYLESDVLYERNDIDHEDLPARWEQARYTAAALNSVPGQPTATAWTS